MNRLSEIPQKILKSSNPKNPNSDTEHTFESALVESLVEHGGYTLSDAQD